jgi:hypothetical protein
LGLCRLGVEPGLRRDQDRLEGEACVQIELHVGKTRGMVLGERLGHGRLRIHPRQDSQQVIAVLDQNLGEIMLVGARAAGIDNHRLPALLHQFLDDQLAVVGAADWQQEFRLCRLGLGHFNGEVLRSRIVTDDVEELVGHVELREHRLDAVRHRGAEGVVDAEHHGRLRRRDSVALKNSFCMVKAPPSSVGAVGKLRTMNL